MHRLTVEKIDSSYVVSLFERADDKLFGPILWWNMIDTMKANSLEHALLGIFSVERLSYIKIGVEHPITKELVYSQTMSPLEVAKALYV